MGESKPLQHTPPAGVLHAWQFAMVLLLLLPANVTY